MNEQSAELDVADQRILRSLQLAPRIPFRRLGAILGMSEQTVARRYRRLRREGVIRITAVVSPVALGQSNWLVRTQCKPSGATALAQALSQRPDVSWVSMMSGGSEIACVLRARSSEARDDLLMQRLPRTAPVLNIAASVVLHRFIGDGSSPDDDWTALADRLDEAQSAAVLERAEVEFRPQYGSVTELDRTDSALLAELTADGRATHSALSTAAGITEGQVRRRLQALQDKGVVYFDVDLSATALGFHASASLWLTVSPARLDAAGHALAAAREVAFAAATSGPQNLAASVVCRDLDELYRFVTDTVGAIAGVQTMEILPVLRHVKQAGAMIVDGRLTDPPVAEGAVTSRRAGR